MKIKKIAKKFRNFLKLTLFFIIVLAVFSTIWALKNYDNIQPDEILFYLSVPIDSTESGIIIKYLQTALLPATLLSIFSLYFIRELLKSVQGYNIHIRLKLLKKEFNIKINGLIINIIINLILLIAAIIALNFCLNKLSIDEYIANQLERSNFIEENYVDVKTAKLKFPKKKRNLIYIYVESLETTFLENDVGGAQEEELMPELRKVIEDNINFSHTNKLGGATQIPNLTWTTAGMVGTTAGLPLKISPNLTNIAKFGPLLEGSYTLGEILSKEGYNQMVMFGSDATFGNRDNYFKNHGNYDIYDYWTAVEKEKITSDYYMWWGFEDSKLFEFAKEEITALAKKDKPFNFTMLTANTHSPDGFVEENCDKNFSSNYANAIACSTKQVADFINWIQEQEFYDNTTIVITGDHLSMDSDFFEKLDSKYNRTVLNAFINSAVESENTSNRLYTTMDLFPTTLASLGVEIPEDRLALGTNLFSNKKTLLEKYGVKKVDKEIQLKSKFYDQQIISKQ